METKEELIELRKSFISYEKGTEIIEKLRLIYKKEYKPKHSKAAYYKLIAEQQVDRIELVHPQTNNYPDKIYSTFSIVSQRVYGYTIEHCLDQIYDAVEMKKKRIKRYKLLPTLEELVNSKAKVKKGVTYYHKEKGSYEDSCNGNDGADILEMRRIGIEAFRSKQFKQILGFIPSKKA